jgi:hypothetical protein
MSTPASPVTISRHMVREHLAQLTDGWFARNNLPPRSVEGYGAYLDHVLRSVERAGDRAAFVRALQHFAASHDEPISRFGDDSFSYSNEQMREIMLTLLDRLGAPRSADDGLTVVVE